MADYTFGDCADIIKGGIKTDRGNKYGAEIANTYAQNWLLPTWKWYNSLTLVGDLVGHIPFVATGNPVTGTINIELTNGNYILVTYTSEVGRVTITATGYNSDGTVYTHENSDHAFNGVTGTTSITYPASGQAGWALGGFDLCFGYDFSVNTDTNEKYGYNAGLVLIPPSVEVGEVYPTIPTEAEAIAPEIFYTKFAHTFLYKVCPIAALNATSSADTSALMDAFCSFMEGSTVETMPYDTPDDNTDETDGASFESANDTIPVPSLPSISALDTGFVSIYRPTTGEIRSVATWLWSDSFYNSVIKNFSSPFENIIGLFISPIVPAASSSTFKIGNVDSNITCTRVTQQRIIRDCGEVKVPKIYNSFADYSAYRSYKLYLPYYGMADLNTDDIVGGVVNVVYNIDILTGQCLISVRTTHPSINNTFKAQDHVINTFHTNLYTQIPINGQNMMSFYTQSLAGAGQLLAGAVSENPLAIGAGVMNMVTAKPSFGNSNGISGNAGLMGIQFPYLIECASVRDIPTNYSKYNGIPTNRYSRLGDLSGYTEVESCRINIASATDDELKEIETILKEGVIL